MRGQASLGRARRKMSEAQRRGTIPPKATRLWTAEEDALVAKLPAAEAAEQTSAR